MFDRFSDRSKKVMAFTRQEAQRLQHECIGTEHILLGIVREGSGVAVDVLRGMVEPFERIREEVERRVTTGPVTVTMKQLPFTPRAKKVLELSMEEAIQLGHHYIGTEHLILGLIKEHDGIAAQVLRHLGVELEGARGRVLELLGARSDADPERFGSDHGAQRDRRQVLTPALDGVSRDLTALARGRPRFEPIGRSTVLRRLIHFLARRARTSIVLVGPEGVGKSAIVEAVASSLVAGEVPAPLHGYRVVELDVPRLMESSRQDDGRVPPVERMLAEIRADPGIILALDDIDELTRADPRDPRDPRHAIRRALARGELRCIGTARAAEQIRADAALQRCLELVPVAPPSDEDVVQILRAWRDRDEAYHRVQYTDDALAVAVRLAGLYIPTRCQPASSIDVMDGAGALVRTRGSGPPPILRELDRRSAELHDAKEAAVANEDLDRAADLREQERRLLEERQRIAREWRQEASLARSDVTVDEEAIVETISAMTGIDAEDIRAGRRIPHDPGRGFDPHAIARFEQRSIDAVLPDRGIAIARGTAFVMIPHRPEFEALYRDVVAPALEGLGLDVSKGNDISEPGAILPQVWSRIRSAELLVAVATGLNPNVVYELGLCHGIGRCPILLVRRAEELPFNLRALRSIEYGDDEAGLEKLRRDLTDLARSVLDLVRWSGD